MMLMVYTTLLLAAVATAGRAPRAHGLQCERITVPACQGLGYNMTALPNRSGHADQSEADIALAELQPLLESGCSKHIRFLVCATIFPLCTPDVTRPVAACRSLCQTVRAECNAVAAIDGDASATTDAAVAFVWPSFIDCDTLPQPERQELCMQVPQSDETADSDAPVEETLAESTEAAAAAAATEDATASALPAATADNDQRTENNAAISVAASSTTGSIWPWMTRSLTGTIIGTGAGSGSGPLIPPIMSPVICAANFTPVSASRCGPLPGTDALYTPQQKRLAGTWTLALAALCFILTLFSLVTFWAEPMRFGYPERPVLFLALCYNLLSVAYLERAIFHQQQQQPHSSGGGLTSSAVSSAPFGSAGGGLTCPASFLLVGYLQLAAAAWWFLFAVCWYLSTVRQWSPEALERRATLLHVLAWCPPALPPVAAVLWDAVRPHELTGMCAARGFVEVPAAVLLVAGGLCIVAASRSLGGMRRRSADVQAAVGAEDEDGEDEVEAAATFVFQKRLAQIRRRIVVFSGVFFVPALAAVVLGFAETGYVTIAACVLGDPCVAAKRWPAWPTLLRLFVTLAGGSLAGMWVWSRKTCESYRTRMLMVTAAQAHQRGGRGQHHHHRGGGHLQHGQMNYGGGGGGVGAYLVAPPAGKVRGTAMPGKKTLLPTMTGTGMGTTAPSTTASVGRLYAGISFHNVPVYSVRAPPANRTH